MKEMMTIMIKAPRDYGLIGYGPTIITDLQVLIDEAVTEYRETSKPVKKEMRGCITVNVVGSVDQNPEFRKEVKDNLLTLTEPQLNECFMKYAPRMPNNDAYFQLTDLFKEICKEKGFDVDKVITYGCPDPGPTEIETRDRELGINEIEGRSC